MNVPTTYIDVSYDTARTPFTAQKLLDDIRKYPTIACDFEVAIRYTKQQKKQWQLLLDSTNFSKVDRAFYESKLQATALDHPSHCTLTHCSIATSDNRSYVFILDNSSITNYILNYLTSTDQKQVWHNASYDFRHLYYHTGKFPYDFEDTQILAKTLINHVNTFKAKTGLKELAGHMYGSWGISSDNFDLEHMYDEHVLKYAAIDSAATMWLWNYINTECDTIDSNLDKQLTIDWEAPY